MDFNFHNLVGSSTSGEATFGIIMVQILHQKNIELQKRMNEIEEENKLLKKRITSFELNGFDDDCSGR